MFTQVIWSLMQLDTKKLRRNCEAEEVQCGLEALTLAFATTLRWLRKSALVTRGEVLSAWDEAALALYRVHPELAAECAAQRATWANPLFDAHEGIAGQISQAMEQARSIQVGLARQTPRTRRARKTPARKTRTRRAVTPVRSSSKPR